MFISSNNDGNVDVIAYFFCQYEVVFTNTFITNTRNAN